MVTDNNAREEFCEELTRDLCVYLRIVRPSLTSLTVEDRVRELVSAKLALVLGIKCRYNYKNELISFFSSIIGDVVVERMGYLIDVATSEFRYFKYDGLNFVGEVRKIFAHNIDLNDSMLNSFNFLERHKESVVKLKNCLPFNPN